MQQGTIARLLIDKGFGFIRDEAGLEHFFHRSAVRGAVSASFSVAVKLNSADFQRGGFDASDARE